MLASEMIVTLLLLFALSVATREAPLFLLTLALLVAAALSRLWERFSLERIEYRRHFSHIRAAFGEQVELEIEVVNRKLLPLSWLEAEDEVPAELHLLHGRVQPSYKPNRVVLANLLALRPYERLRRRYTLSCTAGASTPLARCGSAPATCSALPCATARWRSSTASWFTREWSRWRILDCRPGIHWATFAPRAGSSRIPAASPAYVSTAPGLATSDPLARHGPIPADAVQGLRGHHGSQAGNLPQCGHH